MFRANDACIVGYGSVYSGTWNARDFIDATFRGECSITDLRRESIEAFPWDIQYIYNPDRKAEDQSYTVYGAFIDRRPMPALAQRHGVKWEEITSLELVSMEAMRQALEPVRHLPELAGAHLIYGQSTIDTEVYLDLTDQSAEEVLRQLRQSSLGPAELAEVESQLKSCTKQWPHRKPKLSYVVATSLLAQLKEKFGLRGPSCLVDAACASSFAALHLAVKKLKSGEANIVVAGGGDVSVTPGCLIFFSRLGAMSSEPTVPFDRKAQGLTQGEGVGLFTLMRLKDAVDRGLPIHGVIRACEGSSDGRSSGIVEPTAKGQRLAYQRAYSEAGVSEVDYLEAHGTGTTIGDRTEIESLTAQFPRKKIPIGSAKANVGHTIAAAGAAGLLRSLGVLQRREAPPSPYFTGYPEGFKTDLFLPTKPWALPDPGRPLTVGLSSFGFGGSNFHMVLQEYRPEVGILEDDTTAPSPVVLCGEGYFPMNELEELAKRSQHRLPPNTLPWIDNSQLLAIYGVEQTLRQLGINPNYIDRQRVAVLATSMIPLDNYWKSGNRVVATALKRQMSQFWKGGPTDQTVAGCFDKVIDGHIRVSEDSLSGFLNGVIAGRICNAFDFQGVSFNIDSDLAGPAAAFAMAKTVLEQWHGMVIVVSAEEKVSTEECRVSRHGVNCYVFASAAYALEHDLPIGSILQEVTYEETHRAHDAQLRK